MSEGDTIADQKPSVDNKIVCQIDNEPCHSIRKYLEKNHPDWTIERYKSEYPDAPLLSAYAKDIIERRRNSSSGASRVVTDERSRAEHMHDLFELGTAPAAMSSSGKPISVTVLGSPDEAALPYVQDIDPNYVFNIDLLKKVIVGYQVGMPIYLWGYHGTGKTTILQQAAARTKRPFVRVQHTAMTEESHILGQYVVRDGATVFELGPLPMAMLNGWIYCADEYDFAMPAVSAVYQPVLEGQNLVIKEAPIEFRVIKPHPEFRFVATGNTNGVGDETGLYQGTMIQNAANYSRFPITEEVRYMDAVIEEQIVAAQASVSKSVAKKLVKFANDIRESFAEGRIGMTLSPRELISAGKLGVCFGGNWTEGLKLAYMNRLSRVDKQTVEQLAQRVFG